MAMKNLSVQSMPSLPLAAGATTPNPGVAGAQLWSSLLNAVVVWNGTSWLLPKAHVGTATPPAIAAVGSDGTSANAASEDHTHAHGAQTDGSMHAVATLSVAGFLSPSDKAAYDNIVAYANTLFNGGAATTVSNANGAGVQGFAARSDHTHAHGAQTDGAMHALATQATPGFLAPAEKALLSELADPDLAGRGMLRVTAPQPASTSADHTLLQPATYQIKRRLWQAIPATNGASIDGMSAPTVSGSATSRTQSITANLVDWMVRVGYATAALTNQVAGLRFSGAPVFLGTLGGAAGGAFFSARFCLPNANANSRLFVGLSAQAAYGSDPTGQQNQVGFGWDASDSAMRLISCGSTTPATETTLASAPTKTQLQTQICEVMLYAPRGGGPSVGYAWRLNFGTWNNLETASPAKMPALNTALYPLIIVGSGTSAVATAIDISHVYIETDY